MSYISELRKLVGHMPIMATAASCILFDKDKGILLEKRTDNGQWCIPGGAIELGEEPEVLIYQTRNSLRDRPTYIWSTPTLMKYITRI